MTLLGPVHLMWGIIVMWLAGVQSRHIHLEFVDAQESSIQED